MIQRRVPFTSESGHGPTRQLWIIEEQPAIECVIYYQAESRRQSVTLRNIARKHAADPENSRKCPQLWDLVELYVEDLAQRLRRSCYGYNASRSQSRRTRSKSHADIFTP